MISKNQRKRIGAVFAVVGLLGTLGACDVLKVSNPGSIDEVDLDDPLFIPEMVNMTINDFQRMYGDLAYSGAIFTDEAVTGHNFTQWEEIDLRIIREDNTQLHSTIYAPLQRARAGADEMSERLRNLVTSPQSDLRLATTLAYAGYGHIMLGEYFCEAPLNPDAGAVSSADILQAAITRFDEAISIATASKSAGASAAEADRIINLSRVGAARASLQLGEKTQAISYATPVPADFTFWVRHASTPTDLRNTFWSATTGTNHNLGVDVYFRDLDDPRVQHTATSSTGHNQKTQLWKPFQSPSFTEWEGSNTEFAMETGIRLASGLEAQYIIAEAQGATAETLGFVNERREVGTQTPVALTGDALMAELRDQRRRDFFMDGHRLGDLRRYLDQYGVDYFPTGAHPNDEAWDWGNYEDATCFVPSRAERIGNPNY